MTCYLEFILPNELLERWFESRGLRQLGVPQVLSRFQERLCEGVVAPWPILRNYASPILEVKMCRTVLGTYPCVLQFVSVCRQQPFERMSDHKQFQGAVERLQVQQQHISS